MNLKRAFQLNNKLNTLMNETKSKFNNAYFTNITKTEKKSEINKLVANADFVDEVIDIQRCTAINDGLDLVQQFFHRHAF